MGDFINGKPPELAARKTRPTGKGMWRSLDELSQTPQFRESLEREFPASIMDFDAGGASRRTFLRLMGASLALAGLNGCSERPSEKIVPYVSQPEQIVPGMPLFFATTMPLNGYGYGVLAESHEGRPTKIEGNPDHPASLGGTNVFLQASVLQLYDPDELRTKTVMRGRDVRTWDGFNETLQARLQGKRASGGRGVSILTGTVTSPTLAAQLKSFLGQFPQARWRHYDPLARDNTHQGAMLAFGKPLNTVHRFRRFEEKDKPIDAKVIVSLDADFLWDDPGSLQYARHFAAARKVRVRHWWQTTMSRLYVVESTFSLTGSMADHRIPARPDDMPAFAEALASLLGVEQSSRNVPVAWGKHLDAIVADLKASRGQCIVIAGESQPPNVHRLVHAINAALGNVGKTVYYTEPVESFPAGADGKPITATDSIAQLTADMKSGQVDTLLIFANNPAYNAPADLKFADALFALSSPQADHSAEYSNFTAYLGRYTDETSFLCQWQLPEAHYLESWGDIRAFDGTASLIQPLIAPMSQGRTASEVMNVALHPPGGTAASSGYEVLRNHWKTQVKGDLDAWWSKSLEKGIIADSRFAALSAPPVSRATPADTAPAASQPATAPGELTVIFRPDPTIWDGTFSNNGWLHECPKFFSKLVWDNAALISPGTSDKLGGKEPYLTDGQILRFTTPDGLTVEAPIMVQPGLPDDVVVMHFGYGRTRGGVASTDDDGHTPRGFSAYALRHSRSPWITRGVKSEPTGRTQLLVSTHNHYAIDALPKFGQENVEGPLKPQVVEHPGMDDEEAEVVNRKLIRTATLEYFNADPAHRHFVKELGGDAEKKPLLSLYPGWDYSKGYQWGMSIDLQSCIGCNACLVACVSENNIPVVGRDEVRREREMHWIRIDQYFADDINNPKVYSQPVPCMQCENAPCEVVCPVGATVHSAEGINQMVYNRCVGTRYCSNNCPYKVRRFNFFNWYRSDPTGFDLQRNPEVTVRSRGVMEKCNYCYQRLQRTRIEIEKMILRDEERIRAIQKELDTAAPEARSGLEDQITQLKRHRHNQEFATLERLQTACQQACPTEAISFGTILPVNVMNKQGKLEPTITQVLKLKQEPLDYPLLAELTTKPRTTYLARLRNPNPDLEPGATS